MTEKTTLVVTTIAAPNAALRLLAAGCVKQGWDFIVIGDQASPPDFQLEGCRFYSLTEQKQLDLEYAALCPVRHYARKNLGYLLAMREGSSLIVETDDDNFPGEDFWLPRARQRKASIYSGRDWVNVYRYFTDNHIWPRGLPLDHINDPLPDWNTLAAGQPDCPVQQGLCDGDADVDAVFRLTQPLEVSFRRDRNLALNPGAWCPFNSQNTSWWRAAFPLLYLPATCTFRMTDIWRSFVAQRIAWTNDWSIMFHPSNVHQERNRHDLMRDFIDELPGYLNNNSICQSLAELELSSGVGSISDNLRVCYEMLVRAGLCEERELDLLDAWVADIERGGSTIGVATRF